MELQALDRVRRVPQAHHRALVGQARGDQQRGRQRSLVHHEGVVARGREARWQAGQVTETVVRNRGRVPVGRLTRAHHSSPVRDGDRLVPKADAEQRHPGPAVPDDVDADPGVGRRARPRRDDDPVEPQAGDLAGRHLVVPHDLNLAPAAQQQVREIVRK